MKSSPTTSPRIRPAASNLRSSPLRPMLRWHVVPASRRSTPPSDKSLLVRPMRPTTQLARYTQPVSDAVLPDPAAAVRARRTCRRGLAAAPRRVRSQQLRPSSEPRDCPISRGSHEFGGSCPTRRAHTGSRTLLCARRSCAEPRSIPPFARHAMPPCSEPYTAEFQFSAPRVCCSSHASIH
jgi:hypothetical protein